MSESPHRWRALEELYQAALERDPSSRPEFLQQTCPDPSLRQEVQTLLDSLESGNHLLERPAFSYAAQPLEPGAMLGPYRIENPIGHGGMGEVYRAADTRLRRAVAIKVLPALYASDPEWLARFRREARLLASFNHPNIAAIYGVEDRALVMELVEGPTLAERIAQGPIPLDEALVIMRQIAGAIGYAHRRRVVHRDLKPANIKLAPAADGLPARVKVLDFGVAKALETSTLGPTASTRSSNVAITMAGAARGTPGYMSPSNRGASPSMNAPISGPSAPSPMNCSPAAASSSATPSRKRSPPSARAP